MRALERHLAWEGCYNTRDLGGLETVDGGETRWQAVIRSDLLGRLTARGRRAMLDYGVRTVIDLRASREVQEKPSIRVPSDGTETLTYLNLPLSKFDLHVETLIRQASTRAQIYSIVLDAYPDAVAEVMRAIVTAPPGGVVIHCHSGKDRTGIVAALLLRLAGVPDDAIAADYAASRERLLLVRELVDKESAADEPDTWNPRTVTLETMHEMLAHVDVVYGGASAYLERAGLSCTEIEQLRNRLRKWRVNRVSGEL